MLLFLDLVFFLGAFSFAQSKDFQTPNQLQFLIMADWGGTEVAPYFTPGEKNTAKVMGDIASETNPVAVIGIGDNIYHEGAKDENDPRFETTFENVFVSPSLENLPFYFIAGNHDHYGNITAQTARNGVGRWNFPALYYSKTWGIPNSKKIVQIVLFDSVTACGVTQSEEYCALRSISEDLCVIHPKGPVSRKLAEKQWAWVENELRVSKADYLLVMAHYPVWSIAEHGPTHEMVEKLRPLLIKYNVTAFLNGHDHTFQYIAEKEFPDLGYVTTGSAHLCDTSTRHKHDVPEGSLKFHGCTVGGFTRLSFDEEKMSLFHYFADKDAPVFTVSIPARQVKRFRTE